MLILKNKELENIFYLKLMTYTPMMNLTRIFISILFYLYPLSQVSADAIVRNQSMFAATIAEFYVEDTQVRVNFEVGYKDIASFQNLLPDELYQKMGFGNKPLKERVEQFFLQDFSLHADGKPLDGYVKDMKLRDRIKRDKITGEALPTADKDKETVITIELIFPFEKKPGKLTLFTVNKVPTNIGFIAYHKKIPINDFRYLGNAYQLTLNWQDPWYSSFNTRHLRRQYYAPMSGFIYIEPFEVRKEIILRPKDLQSWIDLGLEDKETIPVDKQADIKQKVIDFLSDHLPVMIDDKPVKGQLDRINFLQRTLTRSTVVDNQEQDLNSATLGIIYSFPTDGLPKKVTMKWDLWNKQITEIAAAAVDQAGPFQSTLQPDWDVLEWQNYLKNPKIPTLIEIIQPPAQYLVYLFWCFLILFTLSILFLIYSFNKKFGFYTQILITMLSITFLSGSIYSYHIRSFDQKIIEQLTADLLHNIYRAFDYREEEKIYDTLNKSVAGDLLTDIYLQTKRSLVLANQGGASAKVKSLELVSTDNLIRQDDGFSVHTIWNVFGSVGHWGHVHQRSNQYEANLSFRPLDGQWKLTAMEVIQEHRL